MSDEAFDQLLENLKDGKVQFVKYQTPSFLDFLCLPKIETLYTFNMNIAFNKPDIVIRYSYNDNYTRCIEEVEEELENIGKIINYILNKDSDIFITKRGRIFCANPESKLNDEDFEKIYRGLYQSNDYKIKIFEPMRVIDTDSKNKI